MYFFVLQSILADAQQICQEQGWGSEELIQLESILCMAMAEPLCLNPNPSLGELAVNRDSTSKQLHSTALRRSRRRWSEGRKRKQADSSQSSNNDFKLHDFLKKKSLLGRGIPPILQVKRKKKHVNYFPFPHFGAILPNRLKKIKMVCRLHPLLPSNSTFRMSYG